MPNARIAVLLAAAALIAACQSTPPPQAEAPVETPPPAAAPQVAEPAPAAEPAAPAVTPAMTAGVTGTVSFRSRKALPAQARIKVQLLEAAAANAPATLMGEQIIEIKGRRTSYAFRIAYDPKAIAAGNRYELSARILADDALLFINDTPARVITGGNPKRRSIVVKPVAKP